MYSEKEKNLKNSAREQKNCPHIVSIQIVFKGESGYYYKPTKYVQKCLYCNKLGEYSTDPAFALETLFASWHSLDNYYTESMTTLKDYINDFGRQIQELEAREDLTPEEYEDLYTEALEEIMEIIKNRIVGE